MSIYYGKQFVAGGTLGSGLGSDDMTPLIDWDYCDDGLSGFAHTPWYISDSNFFTNISSDAYTSFPLYISPVTNEYYVKWKRSDGTYGPSHGSPFYSDGRYALVVIPLKEDFTKFRELLFIIADSTVEAGGSDGANTFTINTNVLNFLLSSFTNGNIKDNTVGLNTFGYVGQSTSYVGNTRTFGLCPYSGSNNTNYTDYGKSSTTMLIDGMIPASPASSHSFFNYPTKVFEIYGIGRK